MIIPDVNLLIHAYNAHSPAHAEARGWWEMSLTGPRQIGLAWVTMLGFIRIMTHRGVMRNPMPAGEALGRVRAWLDRPQVEVLTPGEDHARIVFRLLETIGVAGNLTTDAHLAALAIEYGAEVATTDTDFGRFPGVRWHNPLTLAKRRRSTARTEGRR